MRSDTVLFDQKVLAGQQNITLTKTLNMPGIVRQMTIVFNPGQQKMLKVRPYMQMAPDIFMSLAKYVGDKPYFSGDNDRYEINVNMPFNRDDMLCVDVSNDSLKDYNMYVLFEVDYEGGK